MRSATVRSTLAGVALCLVALAPATAATISSTPAGGPWIAPSTWVGGILPGISDDVTIDGPVQLPGNATRTCRSVEVTASGLLQGNLGGMQSWLIVTDDVTNYGTITDGAFWFHVEVGGDLRNEGTWNNHATAIGGTGDHLVTSTGPAFDTQFSRVPGTTGTISIGTALNLTGNVDLGTDGPNVLLPGADLDITLGIVSGDIDCGGNAITLTNAYLADCNLHNAVVNNTVNVGHLVTFTGGLTVNGTLQNNRSSGNAHTTITGPLVNHGIIKNDHYGFTIQLNGDLICSGEIHNSYISMDDAAPRTLNMAPAGEMTANLILPEFGGGQLTIEGAAHLIGGVSLGLDGTLILDPNGVPGPILISSISGGDVFAHGNTITAIGSNAAIFADRVDQAVLAGAHRAIGDTRFTGGLTVLGSLESHPWLDSNITVEGTLRNEGAILDGAETLTIGAEGDLLNLGSWTNSVVRLHGDVDQHVHPGAGISVPTFELDSKLTATSYEWFRDGIVIPGETASVLTLASVGAADFGVYTCVGDGSTTSRSITIGAIPTDTPVIHGPSVTSLSAARPNPFRTGTAFDFALATSAAVSLAVYDVTGRHVAQLVEETRNAGLHSARWDARGIAPGVYFVRLDAAGESQVRRTVLLR